MIDRKWKQKKKNRKKGNTKQYAEKRSERETWKTEEYLNIRWVWVCVI